MYGSIPPPPRETNMPKNVGSIKTWSAILQCWSYYVKINSFDILFRQEQLTQSKYASVPSNDNRNLSKYIIHFILKITHVFSNRATSEHSATLLKFVWATPKRFFAELPRKITKGRARGKRETSKILFSKCNRMSRDSPWTDRNSIVLNKCQKEKEKPSSE